MEIPGATKLVWYHVPVATGAAEMSVAAAGEVERAGRCVGVEDGAGPRRWALLPPPNSEVTDSRSASSRLARPGGGSMSAMK